MKFALLFGMTDETWSHVSVEETARVDAEIAAWLQRHAQAGTIVQGADLMPSANAQTIRWQAGSPTAAAGPFTTGEDVLGGYAIVEVPDMDAALALAETWPALQVPGESVEVRPLNG